MTSTAGTRKVPFFNYPHVFTSHEDEFVAAFRDVGRRGAFILQRDVEEFESALAARTGARFALGVANGTDALIMAVRCAGIGPGDEVIFCSHTFIATAASIYFAGAKPVAVDCGPDHMMEPKAVEKAITARTKAIMPTQLNGRVCDMDALQAIAKKHDLIIIEDAAQGLGGKFKGRCAGTFGLAGTISFYPAKNLGALGDAGAVLTNDETMYEKLHAMRDHGRDREGEIVMWGLNSRLDNLQAALLNCRLRHYDEIVEQRRHLASLYQEWLGGLREVVLPPAPGAEKDHFDVFQNYEIEADRRDDLKKFLADKGVGTLIQWGGKPVHQFKALNIGATLPYTDKLFTRMLMLPMHNGLTEDDVKHVCTSVREFFKK